MSRTFGSRARASGALVAGLSLGLLIASVPGSVAAGSDPSPAPDVTARPVLASPRPMSASPLGSYPLPEDVASVPADIPTVSLAPTSGTSVVVGTAVLFELGHCGLLSPIDVDGSLWQPVGGTDAAGGPIASDEAIGELINATSGELLLVTGDSATFTTPMGSVIYLARAPGALDYPLCM